MKLLQVRMPDQLHGRMRTTAKKEGLSVNQLVVTSVSHEIIRQETSDFFSEAARCYNADDFAAALASIPDDPPDERDRLD